MGAAEFCWHAARTYTLERSQFGRPLAANQLIQKKLSDMLTEVALGLQGCIRVGRLLDEGRLAVENISMLSATTAGRRSTLRACPGTCTRQRHFRRVSRHRHVMNLETVNTYEGTEDVHALILGRAQTELPAF